MTRIKHFFFLVVVKIFMPKSNPFYEERFIKEAINFWKKTSTYNASNNTVKDIEKMQYTILRENHVIEKGMSMRTPKLGFGQEKVLNLLDRLNVYYQKYGSVDSNFLFYPLSTIKSYIKYTEDSGVQIPEIKNIFLSIQNNSGVKPTLNLAGIVETTKHCIQKECNKDFKSLLYSRHSIRYFSSEPVSHEIIIKALELAQRTPSACNRQAWKTHVFEGEKSISLIKWQAGSRGFEDECRYSILVTSNLKAFLWHEVHQAYIDGGLYAMNLINALHSLGLGCIPLSCGFEYEKLQQLSNFEIPENEVPIVIIAFGNLQEKFNVAASSRKDISLTNTFHN